MRKYLVKFILLVFAVSCLTGCVFLPHLQEPTTPTTVRTEGTEPSDVQQTTTAEEPTTVPTTEETTIPEPESEHSPLYIPDLPVEDVIAYFNEVCLDAEFVNGGDATRLQKWTAPIYYMINGEPTDEDLAVLTHFTEWLNTVEGFPGISETQELFTANLQIFFCTQQELITRMGDNFSGMDGAVTFWYENDEIYNCTICIRTDLHQQVRNSVIQEELYNGLGPVQDTALREDSIIYSGYSEPQELTPVDELILKLLYHPDIICGMDAEACETVIRQLYY